MEEIKPVPKFLYHRVLGMSEVTPDTIKNFVKSIMMYGLFPLVADEWRSLLPLRLQSEPIVWLVAGGIYQGFEAGRILQIDVGQLDGNRLSSLDLPGVDWWVYEGLIPPAALGILKMVGK